MLEVRSEKMKVRDEKNREPFCDVDPNETLHRMGLAGMGCNGQVAPKAGRNCDSWILAIRVMAAAPTLPGGRQQGAHEAL